MTEIEIGIFDRMALKGRIGDETSLKLQVAALEAKRNKKGAKTVGVLPQLMQG